MPKAKQFSVSHENRPGMLAEIAKALGDQKVNILSCLTTTSGTEGTTHLLVDNVNKAKKALAAAQLSYTEADVLHVELPNKPGALGKFAMKLADNNIGVRYRREALQEDHCGAHRIRLGQGSPHSIVGEWRTIS